VAVEAVDLRYYLGAAPHQGRVIDDELRNVGCGEGADEGDIRATALDRDVAGADVERASRADLISALVAL
jgi:hypothetical protein